MNRRALARAIDAVEPPGFEHLSSCFKPLTLLWVMARIGAGEPCTVRWSQFRTAMPDILERYGSALPEPDVRYPFWELQTSSVWAVTPADDHPWAPYAPSVPWLDAVDPVAGFPAEAGALLIDPGLRSSITTRLIARFFPTVDAEALRRDLAMALPQPHRGVAAAARRRAAGHGNGAVERLEQRWRVQPSARRVSIAGPRLLAAADGTFSVDARDADALLRGLQQFLTQYPTTQRRARSAYVLEPFVGGRITFQRASARFTRTAAAPSVSVARSWIGELADLLSRHLNPEQAPHRGPKLRQTRRQRPEVAATAPAGNDDLLQRLNRRMAEEADRDDRQRHRGSSVWTWSGGLPGLGRR
ncbi:hypothetical protein [Actinoplanes sp. URMC 104]|uniref:hypothetical protein n=1 Tax=Actinoplanes sp. URMC 104 TaxID=3423409 RepID=UPI003F1A2408